MPDLRTAPELDEFSTVDTAEIRRCARVLLRHPLLHLDSPDGELLRLIYRHREALRRLFTIQLGYPLVIERRSARLYKAIEGSFGRGIPDFSPRAYAYLALTLACLVDSGRQILLSQLVTDIRGAAGEAGIAATTQRVDLRALAAALRHLVGIGILQETEGRVSAVAHLQADEALITIDTERLVFVLPTGTMRTPEDTPHQGQLQPDAGHAVGVIARRRLIEEPVVLYSDLPAEEAQYLRSHLRQEAFWAERFFGLQLEARSEGVLAVDPEDYLTDLPFPSGSTVARIAVLALPRLLEDSTPRVPDGCDEVTVEEVRAACLELVRQYPKAWAKADTANPDRLAANVVELLLAGGLAKSTVNGNLAISPAAHRWNPQIVDQPRTGDADQGEQPEDAAGEGLW
jgi:uncharacterized protein (TIGR02678 family)